MNKFQIWAAEINKDWSPNYNAIATENALHVTYDGGEVARIDYNAGRYTVSGADKDAVDQLNWMVER